MIKQLDEETINQIAAGEVIERPASVVKELIENSLDAGADKIDVVIADGGRKKIVIEDNGYGMNSEEAEKAILRHTTSKIKDYNDLWNILTMGFRGEALSSIASVSQMNIITKQDNDSGTRIDIEGGEVVKKNTIASNTGTKVMINNLFFNVPARKKFLKSRNYEQKQITDIVTRYALIHTGMAFSLRNEEGVLVEKPSVSSVKENMAAIYGIQVAKETFPVNKEGASGCIAKPTVNRSSRDYMAVYVNNRSVKSKIVEDAILDAMRTLIFHGRFPIAVLNLQLGPGELDVNVHPAKRIVKFNDEEKIYQEVFDAVIEGMQSADLFTTSKVKPKQQTFQSEKTEKSPGQTEKPSYFSRKDDQQGVLLQEKEEDYDPGINIIGQIHKTYIVIETEEGYSLVDQHAAEERINYEKIKEQFDKGTINKQELLNGYVIDLTASEFSFLMENAKKLENLGFWFEEFGKNSVILRQIPSTVNTSYDLKDTLLTLSEKEKENQEETLKYMACRSSVKAGAELNHKQMKDLIKQLMLTNNKYTCPHGRPTMLRYPLSKIEKDFKRVE